MCWLLTDKRRLVSVQRMQFKTHGVCPKERITMPQGDKSSYTDKQKRQAEHIEAGYEKKGLSVKTAEARAWATVNKLTGGGKKSGSGRKKK